MVSSDVQRYNRHQDEKRVYYHVAAPLGKQ